MQIFDQDIDLPFVLECYAVSCSSIPVMIALEILSWDSKWQAKLQNSKMIRGLYMEAIVQNILLLVVLAPPMLGVVSAYLTAQTTAYYPWYVSIPGTIITQGLGYSLIHAWMHKPSNYWIHKYHHQHNQRTFVRPVSANAVSVAEMSLAYIFPLILGLALCRTSKSDMFYVTGIITWCNVLIHTPESLLPSSVGGRTTPSWLCTNEKHFLHHEKNVKRNYSAPVVDFGWVVDLVFLGRSHGNNRIEEQTANK